MLLARMGQPGRRGLLPVAQSRFALCGGQRHGGAQPLVERTRRPQRRRPEGAQVVVAQPAADDEDALVTQRRQRPAQRQVLGGIEPRAQGELHHGHVGTRIGHGHGGEHAVVEAALGIDRHGQPGRLQQFHHAPRQGRIARRGVLDRIRILRKAVVVIDHGRVRMGLHGEGRLLPVCRHHQNGTRRPTGIGRQTRQRLGQPRIGPLDHPRHPRPGAAAMGNVEHRQARAGSSRSHRGRDGRSRHGNHSRDQNGCPWDARALMEAWTQRTVHDVLNVLAAAGEIKMEIFNTLFR